MRRFASLRDALQYTVDDLIDAGCKYTIYIRGPWDTDGSRDCSFRVVPQHAVFFDRRLGLTLELSFNNDPENHPLHDRFLTMPGHKRFHPFKCEFDNVACYAAKLGTDVDGAAELTARVLETLFGCTAETDFECEVHDEGLLTNRRLLSDFGTLTDDITKVTEDWDDLDRIVADVEDDVMGHEYDA